MKLSKINILLLGFIALFFASCNPTSPDDGFFKVGEQTYYVNEAALQDVGKDNGYYQLRLTLDNTNSNDPHSINFLFYSEVNEYLPSGLYIPYAYDDKYEHRFKRGAWLKGDAEAGVTDSDAETGVTDGDAESGNTDDNGEDAATTVTVITDRFPEVKIKVTSVDGKPWYNVEVSDNDGRIVVNTSVRKVNGGSST